ncbi:hypothetical protein BC826DRAFT_966257 [Russula brevipes]|nr:hypothetical protein BC826DRAFT_966257 [Russula brevipes]
MPPTTRPKNANQHPGRIVLADVKKRRTKEEIAQDTEKARVNEEMTKAALIRLRQFVADEEDQLAKDDASDNAKIVAPSWHPVPMDRQKAFFIRDGDENNELGLKMAPGKRMHKAINSDDDSESEVKSNSGDTTAPGKNKLEGKKKRRVEARDTIQALRKMSVDDGPGKINKDCATSGNITEKPTEPARVVTWHQALADARRAVRDRSQTFGPGSKEWPSANHGASKGASVSSGSVLTPGSHQGSEVEPNIIRKFGGLEDETGDSDDFLMLLEEDPNALAVKVEDTHLPLSTKKRAIRQSKYTNADLPGGVHDNNDWRKRFITTYEKWLGMRAEPWIISEHENVAALQAIWNVVYPHIDYVVDVECAVYYIANQRASEWRSGFGSSAVAMFKAMFADEKFSPKDKISAAKDLLRNSAFIYSDPTGETQKEYRGLFRSPWILQLFAGHYDSISGAVRVLEFESVTHDQQILADSLETNLRPLDEDSQEALQIAIKLDIMRMYPKGALALCAAAVERALGIFASEGDASTLSFNKRWNKQVQKFREIIERKLQVGSMEDIVLKACPYMKPGTKLSSFALLNADDNDSDIEMFVDV